MTSTHLSRKRPREADEVSIDSVRRTALPPEEESHARNEIPNLPVMSPASPYIVIHRVICNRAARYHELHKPSADYFDVPCLYAQANRKTCLQGQQQLVDIADYLEDHTSLAFVVYMTYSCNVYHQAIKDSFKRLPMPHMDEATTSQAKPYFYVLQEDARPAKPYSESLMLSVGLDRALSIVFGEVKGRGRLKRTDEYVTQEIWRDPGNLSYPYLRLYHQRQDLINHQAVTMEPSYQERISALSGYLDDRLGSEYAEAENLFEKGLVSRKHWPKLYDPNAVILTMESGQPVAYIMVALPRLADDVLPLECWTWEFDGKFFRNTVTLALRWPSDRDNARIVDLDAYPLKYAPAGVGDELRRRGKAFWDCRVRNYVKYDVSGINMEVQKVRLTITSMFHVNNSDRPIYGIWWTCQLTS
jgi:hypothetical protein